VIIFLQPAASNQNIRNEKQTYLRPIAACCKSVWMAKDKYCVSNCQ